MKSYKMYSFNIIHIFTRGKKSIFPSKLIISKDLMIATFSHVEQIFNEKEFNGKPYIQLELNI